MQENENVSIIVGKTLTNVEVDRNADTIIFSVSDGSKYEMYHEQDCCESVIIEDINGDMEDLLGSPVLVAEESTNSTENPKIGDEGYSWTWPFYKFATVKGYVTIRWYGCSNGYYSESVDFCKIDPLSS